MITAQPLQPKTAAELEASPLSSGDLALCLRYQDLEDAERLAICRGDFAAANRALRSRLAVKAQLLLGGASAPRVISRP